MKIVSFEMIRANLFPIIQIAGFHTEREVMRTLHAGATHVGFPLDLDVNKEDCSAKDVGTIVANNALEDRAVLITYAESVARLSHLLETTHCGVLQAHGNQSVSTLRELRILHPTLVVMKSIVIGAPNWQQVLDQYTSVVDVFITDTYDPVTGARGATGKTHDWNVSKTLCTTSPKPVVVAGGLTPKNVAEAITTIRPMASRILHS